MQRLVRATRIILAIVWSGCFLWNVKSQANPWFYQYTSGLSPEFEFYEAGGKVRGISVEPDPAALVGDLVPAYGPQPRRECPLNPRLLDPLEIARTRSEIDSCSEPGILSHCYFAQSSKYRTIDGSCNNIEHPSWGKSYTCLRRILPFDYGDGVSYPRISCTGKKLPNPRLISNVFHHEIRPKVDRLTTQFMEWGQMLAHDLSFNDIFRTRESGGNFALQCCNPNPIVNEQCMSVKVPPKDPFYRKFGVRCINVVRTLPCPGCHGKRQHLNQNTAYHDLSLLYGSIEEDAARLRSGKHGMLKITFSPHVGPMPPTVAVEELCVSPRTKKSCYKTGDARSNQNPLLLAVHVMLLRYHNFLCQELHLINPHWDDERLFQEARRIAIAQMQFITYAHYLPHVLGIIMEKEGLTVLPGAQYTKYDPTLDASIADEYTTVAARYGHSLIPNRLSEIDPKTGAKDSIWLRDYFYRPFDFPKGQLDLIQTGMTKDRKMKHDVFLGDDIRNYLYRRVYLNETTGLDLALQSIARGRDHGIPGYTYYLEHLFNITVLSFEDLRKILPEKSVDLLAELYKSVHDIDLYSAGLAEYYVEGGFVGPTFGTILGLQYKRIKYGDRYWFEHKNQPGSFTPEQLLEIKRTLLSRIICETSNLDAIQERVFFPPSPSNPVVPCERLHRFNFYLWKE